MRQFTITVTKCGECPHEGYDGIDNFCNVMRSDAGSLNYQVHDQNKDRITPSCPMWNETVEVSE